MIVFCSERTMKRKNISNFALRFIPLTLFFTFIFRGVARADNLGALVYLIFIWPLGFLFFILLIILSIILNRKISRQPKSENLSRLPKVVLIISLIIAVIFPILTIVLDNANQTKAPSEMIFMTILPVEIAAALCISSSILLLRRRSR